MVSLLYGQAGGAEGWQVRTRLSYSRGIETFCCCVLQIQTFFIVIGTIKNVNAIDIADGLNCMKP